MGTDKRERQKAGRQARIEAARVAQEKAEKRAKLVRIGVIALVVVAALAAVALFQRKDENVTAGGEAGTTTTTAAAAGPASVPPPGEGKRITGDTPCPATDGSAERTTKFEKAPPMCIDPQKDYEVTFDTNKGIVKSILNSKGMPNTANNFIVLARYKYYDGTAIFRVDPSIDILQGGSPHSNSANDEGPGYTIKDEGGKFTYKQGQLVMARSQGPDSSGAQFFFTTGPKVSQLDEQGTYLNFGEIVEGLDILQGIQKTGVEFPPDSPMAGLGSGPKEPVIINKVTVAELT